MTAAGQFDWSEIRDESTPVEIASAYRPPATELTGKQILRFLEVGAVGGGVFGVLVAMFSQTPFLVAVAVGAAIGAIAWTALSAAMETIGKTRSILAGFVKIVYGLTAVLYAIAFVVMIGMIVYVRTSIPTHGEYRDYVPPATIH